MTDASKDKALMNDTAASAFIVKYMQKREREKLMVQYAPQIEAGQKFLSENGKAEGVVTLPSGLQISWRYPGHLKRHRVPKILLRYNIQAQPSAALNLNSSYDRGEPTSFRVSNVIRGWVEGLQLMQEGSKYMLYIPTDLAYGERGAGSIIKPFETLIFEVELLEIIKE